MVAVTVAIQKRHFEFFKDCALDGFGGTKAMFRCRAGFQIAHAGLHHRAQVAGRVVMKFQNAVRGAVVQNHNAFADLSRLNTSQGKSYS